MTKQVFEGIKVADFAWVIVGPRSTQHLAEHGATVVRIESTTHPETLRMAGPFRENKPGVNRSAFYPRYNTNKYGVSLNLNHPKARDIALKLVEWADIVSESFPPGRMKKWGLADEDLVKVKPDIIMFSACNQGQTGPHAKQPGYGVQLASLAGFTNLTAWPDRVPGGIYGAYTDFVSPHFIVATLAAALDYRRRTGKGLYIDNSQLECGVQFLSPVIMDYMANGRVWKARGNRVPHAAPHGIYRCQGDDRWVAIAVSTDDEWESFCRVMGSPKWTEDPKFSTLAGRKDNEDELEARVEEWTSQFEAEEVMQKMQEAGVAAGIAAKSEDVYNNPQLKHRRHFWEMEHPEVGKLPWEGPPFILSKTPAEPKKPAPCLGEDNDYVYTELLGLSDEEFVQLMSEGVFE
jgi:crotonobetainyl-CoA:carnitine CoA-transferase CaiB-like acyl-CoA transferase